MVGFGLGVARALGFWWLLRDPPKHYYFARVTTGAGIPLFLFPPGGYVPLTHQQASLWRVDLTEQFWGSQVDLYRWDEQRWTAV